MAELISEYNIGVLCSEVDIHPLSLIEMMASGVPVVATSVGGVPEIVTHEASGLLVPGGDSGALADAILRLIHDPALAARLAENGRRVAIEKFSKEKMMRSIEDTCAELYER